MKETNKTFKETILPELLAYIESNYNITAKQIFGRSRKANIAIMRNILILSVYRNKWYYFSLTMLGKLFGNRHHATILNSINSGMNIVQTDELYCKIYNQINEEFIKIHYLNKKALY